MALQRLHLKLLAKNVKARWEDIDDTVFEDADQKSLAIKLLGLARSCGGINISGILQHFGDIPPSYPVGKVLFDTQTRKTQNLNHQYLYQRVSIGSI